MVVGSRGMAETVVRTRENRTAKPETRAGPTDVMSTYPEEEDDFEPTVAIGSFSDRDVAEAEEDATERLVAVEGDEPEEVPDPVPPEGVGAGAGQPEAPALTPMGSVASPPRMRSTTGRRRRTRSRRVGRPTRALILRDQDAIGRKLVEAAPAISASRRRSSASSAAPTSRATS